METWLQSLLFFLRPGELVNRWSSELVLLTPLPLLLGLEVLFSRGKDTSWSAVLRPDKSGWWDFAFALAQFSGLRKILSNLVFFGLADYLLISLGDASLRLLSGFPYWLQMTGAVLLFDFLYYWNHRIRHASDWIWQVHEFHHSATKVNLLTSYRVHPLDNLIRIVTIALPFQLLLGLDLKNSLAIVFVASIPGIYSHARIDYDFGWLGRFIFVTPRFHHFHHTVSAEKHANYGNMFVFWDRLFGSYQSPDVPIEQIEQGIEDNFYLRESPLRAMMRPVWRFYSYPFRRIVAGIKRISPARKAAR